MINRNDMIFSLTADLRRRPQTFLSADSAGKKHVNHASRVIIFSNVPE
jgi:hypothetical protein